MKTASKGPMRVHADIVQTFKAMHLIIIRSTLPPSWRHMLHAAKIRAHGERNACPTCQVIKSDQDYSNLERLNRLDLR